MKPIARDIEKKTKIPRSLMKSETAAWPNEEGGEGENSYPHAKLTLK